MLPLISHHQLSKLPSSHIILCYICILISLPLSLSVFGLNCSYLQCFVGLFCFWHLKQFIMIKSLSIFISNKKRILIIFLRFHFCFLRCWYSRNSSRNSVSGIRLIFFQEWQSFICAFTMIFEYKKTKLTCVRLS